MTDTISVAFVCLGNICRSPMAEAVFAHLVKTNNLSDKITHIESFGTAGYHVGETPDSRTVKTCKSNNVPINHRAQQIKASDFNRFDYVICMDDSNLYNLQRIQPKGNKSTVCIFGNWNTEDSQFDSIVDDPYYGGHNGFEVCYQQCVFFTKNFIKRELGITLK